MALMAVEGTERRRGGRTFTNSPIPRTASICLSVARAEVEETLTALPQPLRLQATGLPVTYERRPSAALLGDGNDPDLFGLFIGAALDEPMESPLPPQIILFLENLWEFSDRDGEIYREEIQITYLHELGHYLGLRGEAMGSELYC